jgi:hypothetical protein
MKDLEMIKKELERKLLIINEALKIKAEIGDNGLTKENGSNNSKALVSPEQLAYDNVEKEILNINNEFTSRDVESLIESKYPGVLKVHKSLVPNALNRLIKTDKLRFVKTRRGRSPATYCRVNNN